MTQTFSSDIKKLVVKLNHTIVIMVWTQVCLSPEQSTLFERKRRRKLRSNFRRSGSELIILRMHMMTENVTFLPQKSASLVVLATNWRNLWPKIVDTQYITHPTLQTSGCIWWQKMGHFCHKKVYPSSLTKNRWYTVHHTPYFAY
jgi:hypothetical protein